MNRDFKPFLQAAAVVISLQALVGSAVFFSFPDWSQRGQFGDMFGVVNALFSGLAFAGLIGALFMQHQELRLQREELTKAREANTAAAAAQVKLAYFQFYELVARHHSAEITNLRRTVLHELETNAGIAVQQGKPLIEIQKDLHLSVSTLTNYYESLGMFLQNGWAIFPEEARTMMLEMLNNSVSKIWPLVWKYKDVIYPTRPKDWARSFQWLHQRITEYRKNNSLE